MKQTHQLIEINDVILSSNEKISDHTFIRGWREKISILFVKRIGEFKY